jgi:hypothetical protein
MGASSVVRKRETEPDNSFMIFSVQNIFITSFIAHEIYQRLVANGAEEAKELGRVTKLLQETIHDISQGLEEPAMRAAIIIPEREAESLNRLLDS